MKHDEKKYTFALTHENRKPVKLAAEDEEMFHYWTKTLARAAVGALGKAHIDFDQYFEILDLDKNEPLSSTGLNRAFRKKGITMHPDKEGGSEESFRQVQQAYDMLTSKLESDELAAKYENLTYTASIKKGGPGVGFGMVVVEDPKTHHVLVKKVLDNKMDLQDIEPAAGGQVLEGDQLIKVQEDDVSTWTLARVVQRLGDLRCPIGSTVLLQFARKVLKDGESVNAAEGDMEESDYEQLAEADVNMDDSKDGEDTTAAAAKAKADKYKRRQSVADHLYSSSSSALTEAEAFVTEKPPSYDSHNFEESDDEEGNIKASPVSTKPTIPPSYEPSGEILSKAAKELEMLKLMNSAMEASVGELDGTSISTTTPAQELVTISTLKEQESNSIYEKLGDVISDHIDDVESLIAGTPGRAMEVLGTENCIAKGIDVKQRSALIAGIASIGWLDESKQAEFLSSDCRDSLNNLNVLNETLKGYEMKQKMRNNSASGGSVSSVSSGNPKRALFKSRLSVVMNTGTGKA